MKNGEMDTVFFARLTGVVNYRARARTVVILERNDAAVFLDNLLDDRQTKPGSSCLICNIRLEYTTNHISLDAFSRVG